MITEKQMKIVNAVNGMKAVDAPLWSNAVYIHSSDGYLFGRIVTANTACIIEEYNQCIEEMKYHYDIPKWCSYNRADKELLTVENSDYSFYEKETFVYGQDVYIEDTYFANKSIKFGCLTLDGDSAILLTEGSHMVYPIAEVSSKPIKSKEDIELEAKENQLDEIMKRNAAKFCRPEQFKAAIKAMQDFGDLAPIKLTEKE